MAYEAKTQNHRCTLEDTTASGYEGCRVYRFAESKDVSLEVQLSEPDQDGTTVVSLETANLSDRLRRRVANIVGKVVQPGRRR